MADFFTITHRRHGSRRVTLLVTLLVSVVLASGASALAGDNGHSTKAHAARTIAIADVAHLHLLKAAGAILYEEGLVTGTFAGNMHATLEIGATFLGSFKITGKQGTVTGHGAAKPHGSGRYESFAGSMTVTGGSGRYVGAHGRSGLYGTFDRRTFTFVVQTTGKFSD
jgi:hypothetical protein